jgi:CRP-like cAMP-binding protein
VVGSGLFEVVVGDKVVGEIGPGGSFGELALLYDAPRAATIVTREPARVWALSRLAFRRTLAEAVHSDVASTKAALRGLKLLDDLSDDQVAKVAGAAQMVQFAPGETICQKGEVRVHRKQRLPADALPVCQCSACLSMLCSGGSPRCTHVARHRASCSPLGLPLLGRARVQVGSIFYIIRAGTVRCEQDDGSFVDLGIRLVVVVWRSMCCCCGDSFLIVPSCLLLRPGPVLW